MIFCLSIIAYAQTPQDRATELKKQAQSSLNQKDYIKARYLFKKAYEAFASRENYPQAIECGVQANALYVRENFYKEGFELCRDMEQLLWTGEQNKKKVFYDLRFLINKERLQMYTALKNPAQAKTQLDKLEEMANLAKNDSLTEVLLYTKANYYYTFNQSTQGDACFRKLINQYKEKKDYAKVSDCYKNLISIARKGNNAPLMERTYESFIVWTDSVKALTAQDELNVLKRKYDESQLTIQEKDDSLSAKQYIIIGLCVLAVILVAGLAILAVILLRFIANNRKLKKSVKIANEHNELKTKFIQNISSQMEPTLNTLATSAEELSQKAPQEAAQMQGQVAALKKFSDDIQELSSLENSLTEFYELSEINVGTFCENVMDKVKEYIKQDVTSSVNAPKLQVKTNSSLFTEKCRFLHRPGSYQSRIQETGSAHAPIHRYGYRNWNSGRATGKSLQTFHRSERPDYRRWTRITDLFTNCCQDERKPDTGYELYERNTVRSGTSCINLANRKAVVSFDYFSNCKV